MNSGSDLEWTDKVWSVYRHALVRYEIARQDLAVAVSDRDSAAEQAARASLDDWGAHCKQLAKLAQATLTPKRPPDKPHSLSGR